MAESSKTSSPLLRANHLLKLSSTELTFSNVKANVLYTKTLEVANPLPAPVEVTIRAGNPERYSVEPPKLTLPPHATSAVEAGVACNSGRPARADRNE